MTTVRPVAPPTCSPSTYGVCATSARRPMPAQSCSAGNLYSQLGRAALIDETRHVVPVDEVRDCVCDHARKPQLPELLDPPGVDTNLLALLLDLDWLFHRRIRAAAPRARGGMARHRGDLTAPLPSSGVECTSWYPCTRAIRCRMSRDGLYTMSSNVLTLATLAVPQEPAGVGRERQTALPIEDHVVAH